MSPRRGAALGGALLTLLTLAACDAGTLGPEAGTGLALQIVLSPELASAPTSGTLHVEGPTSRTVPLAPGQTTTIDHLQPGAYTLSLEAFANGLVVGFGESTATVVAGQNRSVTIRPANFVPTGLTAPAQVAVGAPVTVSFQAVPGAQGYVVQWANNPEFTNLQSFQVDGTSSNFNLNAEGIYHVRVFARTRFGSDGEPSAGAQVEVVPATLALQDGVPITGRTGTAGSFTVYTFDVPAGGANRIVQFRVRGGTGNPDLYVRQGAEPTTGTFDCRSALFSDSYSNNLDFCTVLSPAPGRWFVGVHGAAAYDGVSVDASILPLTTLADGTPLNGISGAISDVRYFTFNVPSSGIATLHLATTGGSGDADLFASPATSPFSIAQAAAWPCVSKESTSDEVCDIAAPQGGPWTIVLTGFTDFTGVSLSATAVPSAAPPVLSNPSFTVVGSGTSFCTNGGTSVDFRFEYADANGDVASTVPVHTRFAFQPSGTTGQTDASYAASGDGFAGSVTANYCVIFGTNTQVSLSASIMDQASNASNEVTVTVPKPAGAAVPGGPQGASVAPGR